MEIFIKVSQFILSFSLLVLIHEFGHFIFARMFGIRVEKFYLFFNPWFSLFKFTYKGTEYGIGWVPFGGYVKIAGMVDESMDTEQMKQPAKPDEFRSKPAWQRLLVMVGGVFMNIVLAICIYIGMSYKYGETYIAAKDVTYGYVFSDLGKEMGFRDGDKIVGIGSVDVSSEDYVCLYVDMVIDQAREVVVERDGELVTIGIGEEFTPRMLNEKSMFLQPRVPFTIVGVVEGAGASKAGVESGDMPVALNGEPMRYLNDYQAAFAANAGKTVEITFERDSAGVTIVKTLPVVVSPEGTIGVELAPLTHLLHISRSEYTFLRAIPAGFKRTGNEIAGYWKQIKLIFSPKTEAYKSLGGVLSIGSIFPGYWSWEVFWRLTAFLSIVLAVMNILPIPALDGGHVLFLLYEVITRRKPSDKFMEYAQTAGLIILFALLLFANGNDIYRFFIK